MRLASRRAGAFAAVVTLVASMTAVLGTSLPASAAGCRIDSVSYKILGEGFRQWIGTNVASIWIAGPATVSRSVSKTATAGSSHGSSDSVDVGINYGVVSAKYNHTWNRSTTTSSSKTATWTYTIQIPKGTTARARLFKKGWNFPARKTVYYRKAAGCPISKSWDVRVRVPNRSTNNNQYCMVRDAKPATSFMRRCANT